MVSKAVRVFNKRTRIVEETLNIRFLENALNVKGNRPDWLFDIDSFTISMNYELVVARKQTNGIAGTKDNIVAGDTPAQTRFERLSKQSHEPPLSRVNTLRSGEDSMQLIKLMDLCTKLSNRVLDLENVLDLEEANMAQAKNIAKLNKRVKKLEKKRKSRPAGLRRLKKVGSSKRVESSKEKYSLGAQEDAYKKGRNIKDINQNADISVVDKAQGRMHDSDMFGVNDLKGDEVIVDVREKIVEREPVAPTTAKQRLARKNELKARDKRFDGNKETKKVQKTLLKKQYENFTGLSFESLDQIHDRLQKLISQLQILRESLSQEDINLKFLRSLPT
nr:hypothetical protein [Tanacetum cinerariifolium]